MVISRICTLPFLPEKGRRREVAPYRAMNQEISPVSKTSSAPEE